MTDGALSELHARLIAMRAKLLKWLVRDGIEGGTLARLAGINAAIEACEAVANLSADAVEAGSAVVADDGREIRLTLHTEAGVDATVALDPLRAVTLSGELIAAALPRLRAP